MQGRHHCVDELPQLASRQLGTPGDILGVEGEQVVGGDEGLVERRQQVREGPRLKVGQHLQQVRHGLLAALLIGAALRTWHTRLASRRLFLTRLEHSRGCGARQSPPLRLLRFSSARDTRT